MHLTIIIVTGLAKTVPNCTITHLNSYKPDAVATYRWSGLLLHDANLEESQQSLGDTGRH